MRTEDKAQDKMRTIQTIHCPNCGSHAERHYIHTHQLIQTQCPACDYFILTRSDTSKVLEAHAPGLQAGSPPVFS